MTIIQNSFDLAMDAAVDIWALSGSQYVNNEDILRPIEMKIQKALSVFALNARRILERFEKNKKFQLVTKCWTESGEINKKQIENDLWNALNLIIHANSFEIIFEHLPNKLSYIGQDNKVISYVLVSTDRKKNIYIDPFSLAYVFLSEVQTHHKKRA